MNMRKRMLEQTANLTPANEIKVEVAAPQIADRPKTAPGMMAALSAAQLRIQELESQGAASTVPVEKIRPNPWQPRIRFDESSLTELAESIKELGLMQPILARRVTPDNGEAYYELIAGERRWRAHQVLGLPEIKALVTDASDADMAVLALAENVSREDLTDYEIGKAMRRVEKEFPDRKRMAESMGMSRSTLYRYFAFDNLPEFMRVDLERNPSLFSGTAASDTYAVLKKHGEPAVTVARDVWKQLVDGSLEQSKFAKLLDASLIRREATPVTSQRDIHKVYSGKTQAGSITKDSVSFTVKLKSAVLTAAQEERIRTVINELFDGGPQR